MRKINVIRTSTSRPEILEDSIVYLKENLIFDGEIKFILHEDVEDQTKSRKIQDLCEKYFDIYKTDSPKIGQGASLKWLFDKSDTDIVFNIEDDWRLIKKLDITPLYDTLTKCDNVNQIVLNKRPIWEKKQYFEKIEMEINNIPLVTSMYWTFIPSLWKLSFILPKLPKNFIRTSGGECSYGLNNHLRMLSGIDRGQQHSPQWIIDKVGTYYYGKIMKKHKQSFIDGIISESDYYNIDNGMYFQHLGKKPYTPELWQWPIPLPPILKEGYSNRTLK
jgi:hypothetical protein